MLIKKSQKPILYTCIVAIAYFLSVFIKRANYEFMIYVAIIILVGILIVATNKQAKYPDNLLWALTGWGIMHMAGGGVFIAGTRLYDTMLIPLSETLPIFKYDQLVHLAGFAIVTCLMYHLLKPLLKKHGWGVLSLILIMAGLGFGAFNEIVEFIITLFVPESGVGGYENTMLDMVFNGIGAVLAMVWMYWREKKR